MGLKYMRGDENWLYGASVAVSVGAVATNYQASWLCDGRTRPVQMTSGTATLVATPTTAGQVGVVIVHSHNIDAARTITIGGGVSGSGAGPTARTNGIPVNPWIAIGTPAVAATVSIAVSGNSEELTYGELLAGTLRTLTNDIRLGTFEWGYLDTGTVMPRNPVGSVPPFDRRVVARYCKGEVFCDSTDADAFADWYESTYNLSRPTAFLPIQSKNDAWVGYFSGKPVFRSFENGWLVSFSFDEWFRKDWETP